jgi:hypothetical protein
MSEAGVGFVRKSLRARERSRRTLDERLGIRFPMLPRLSGRRLSRLPLGSVSGFGRRHSGARFG